VKLVIEIEQQADRYIITVNEASLVLSSQLVCGSLASTVDEALDNTTAMLKTVLKRRLENGQGSVSS